MSERDQHLRLMDYIYSSPNSPTCENFAEALGLKDTRIVAFSNLDEKSKLLATYHLLRRLRMQQTELQQDIIYHKFSALYLPSLVDRFLMAPQLPAGSSEDSQLDFLLNNAYMEMMSAVSHTPYFAKFLRSRLPAAEGGKKLIHVLAERLVEVGPSWDRKMLSPPISEDHEDGYFQAAAGTSIQLLTTLLAGFIKEAQDSPVLLSQEAKASLLPWIKKWERRYRSEFLGLVCTRTRQLLEANAVMMQGAREIRRSLKNWNVCGNPRCESTSNLKVCGRCQTVRYCCPEHQKAHWLHNEEPHKKLCYTADF